MSGWDEEAGYDLSDPKHPTWGERMADRADMERKRAKEEATSGAPGRAYHNGDLPDMAKSGRWGVYSMAPVSSRPPELRDEDRCEAACLAHNVVQRCLLARGHDGFHVGHP